MSSQPSISPDEVAHLAHLARMTLTDDELTRYAGQLDHILHAVERVSEVAADDVVAMSHPQPMVNVWREDVVTPGLIAEEVLAQAPASQDDRFRVPRILDGE
jgi:aspartyl-tRNA(Asn)/glutamyl-tRNA(Gln) amidotransferase subunit C